jgi:hypothetical protein
MPAAIVAISPGLDLTRTGESMDGKAGIDPLFTRESLGYTAALYLAGHDPNHPMLSPAVCADLTDFPPMLLQAGTNEVLLDDATRLAVRARDAGVDVILDITAMCPTCSRHSPGILDEADEALDRAALFLTQHIRRSAIRISGTSRPLETARYFTISSAYWVFGRRSIIPQRALWHFRLSSSSSFGHALNREKDRPVIARGGAPEHSFWQLPRTSKSSRESGESFDW